MRTENIMNVPLIIASFSSCINFIEHARHHKRGSWRTKKPTHGTIYLGSGGDQPPKEDVNGKTYYFFTLLTEGEHQGKYVPSYPIELASRYSAFHEELQDLLISGYNVFPSMQPLIIDPKGSGENYR